MSQILTKFGPPRVQILDWLDLKTYKKKAVVNANLKTRASSIEMQSNLGH